MPDELSAEELHSVLERVSEAITVVDAQGRLLYANERAARMSGFRDAAEMAAAPPGSIAARYQAQDASGHAIPASEWPTAQALETGRPAEALLRFREIGAPEERWALVTSSPADWRGRRVVVTAARDVTHRRRAEDAWRFLAEASVQLGSSLEYQKTLAAVARLAVPQVADWVGVEMLTAGGSEQLAVAHVDPAKVRWARELREKFPPDQNDGVHQVMRTGESMLIPEITEDMVTRGARSPEHLHMIRELGLSSLMIVPIVVDERTAGAITFVATESGRRYGPDDLRLAEEIARRAGLAISHAALYARAREAVEVRDVFLSVASHELKTPLTSLSLQAETLERELARGETEAAASRIPRIARQVLRLRRLVDQLLDASRINAGRLQLEPEPLDLCALVREVVSRFEDEAARLRVPIRLHLPEKVEGAWDRMRLEEAVTNLVSNALRHGGASPVDVEVEDAGAVARIAVTDQGPGVSQEDRARIFERFERIVSSGRHTGGLGLGLWIVRTIAEAHGGRIDLQAPPDGRGARFVIELPR
jgi:signal transduction histidine kinase